MERQVQGNARQIRLNADEQRSLADALRELEAGRSRRFEDLLWLGFGDLWTTIRTLLIRQQFVDDLGGDGFAITPRGSELIRRCSPSAAK